MSHSKLYKEHRFRGRGYLGDSARLAALHAYDALYDALDKMPAPPLRDLTKLAAYVCQTSMAMLTLVDDDHQCFIAGFGLDAYKASLEKGFCPEVVIQGQPIAIPDTAADERFCDNPVVIEDNVRFYAGVPLKTSQDHIIGTICVADTVPHRLSNAQLESLESIARQAIDQLELRLLAQQVEPMSHTLTEGSYGVADSLGDTFLAVLSHELRSPLNPIVGWSKLLRRGGIPHEKTQDALETIERNALLEVKMIDELLDASQILRGKVTLNKKPTLISGVANAVLEKLQPKLAQKSISCRLIDHSNRAMVHGDKTRLQQIIEKILDNALKFSSENGQIKIVLTTEEHHEQKDTEQKDTEQIDGEQRETANLTPVERYVQLQVIDNGRGISAEFLPSVFARFRQEDYSTTRQFGGLGLGLAMTQQLVELHDGTIDAQSEGIDQGAIFTVKLPVL